VTQKRRFLAFGAEIDFWSRRKKDHEPSRAEKASAEKTSAGLGPGRGVSEKVSAVGFCLGSGLFGSCNSN
jgi:hypothetical protein